MASTGTTPVRLLDGGLGTSLADNYDVKFDDNTPLWSSHLLVADPDTLRACQKDFAEVPVDILLTATYQVSVESFSRTKTLAYPEGIDRSKIPSFLELAVSIAEEVKAPTAELALSLGPYGACMIPNEEYSGKYDDEHNSTEQLLNWHRDRIRLFDQIDRLKPRVTYIGFETVPRLDEIKAIRKLFGRTPSTPLEGSSLRHGDVPYWISCVFPGDHYILPDGSSVDQVIDALLSPNYSDIIPWGIGINCTKVAKLPELLQAYETAVSRLASAGQLQSRPSLVLYPDGTNGEVYDITTKSWQLPESHQAPVHSWERQLADCVKNAQSQHYWRSVVVGGCCKARHQDITRLREALRDG
ncbi:Homocysteine S-methyltransferase [Whalleya microplaca]|nr:Homocysteine S-methyltransferase [Whalleya microplaca]